MIALISETCESHNAIRAFKGTIAGVCSHVNFQVPLLRESLVASRLWASKQGLRILGVLVLEMDPKPIFAREAFTALLTVKFPGFFLLAIPEGRMAAFCT